MSEVGRWEQGLISFLRNQHSDVLDWLTREDPKIKGEAESRLKSVLDAYAKTYA